ncbi:leucine-rich repeat-containing protein 34 [Astyanax mexicanus]|uniref:leucine-rich repeat-containing protein 34 n=1 Tax=Astyanax mexicanus TaxID=7994 RepID=UPI0020CACD82|nr:leucine-rich repeat-containing protein 34 [Astyanax mexicanus]
MVTGTQGGCLAVQQVKAGLVMGDLKGVYLSVCDDLQLDPNPCVSRVLTEAHSCSSGISLRLRGNERRSGVNRLSDTDLLLLSKTLRNEGSVKAVDLRYNRIADEGAGHLADLLQENEALESLDLMCNDIEVQGAERLAKSLHQNATLKRLRMTGNKIGNKGAKHFASMLQINTSLEDLDVSDCDLGTQSLIAFAIVLNNNRNIRSINISRPLLFSLQEETTIHMARMLAVNQTLRELHMGKHGMTDSGVERLCEALMINCTLRYLDLRCNRISRDGAKCLAGVLKKNNTLEILDLSSNRIEDDGAVYLSKAIMQPHCKLRALSITSNNIATTGLVSLTKAMVSNPQLTHIYIWGNRLEEPLCVAFSQLIASGRLLKEHTDVFPYEVDGHFYLAEVFHGLRRHYYWTPSYSQDGDPASNAALALNTSQCLELQP